MLVWSQEAIKSKIFFDLWEGPYVVMARLSEVSYKLSKVSNPNKVRFLHFDMLKRYDEETLRPEETLAKKRPTTYRSANFSDAPEMHVEDEAFWANNREGFNHDPGPRPDISRRVPLQNQRSAEPTVTTRGRPEGLRRQIDVVETYGARKIEARREDEPANLPNEAEGRPLGEAAMVEPVMESGTTDVGRPVRVRRPPVRFGIDEFVSQN